MKRSRARERVAHAWSARRDGSLEHHPVFHVHPHRKPWILGDLVRRVGHLDPEDRGLPPQEVQPTAGAVLEAGPRALVEWRSEGVVEPDPPGIEEQISAHVKRLPEETKSEG